MLQLMHSLVLGWATLLLYTGSWHWRHMATCFAAGLAGLFHTALGPSSREFGAVKGRAVL